MKKRTCVHLLRRILATIAAGVIVVPLFLSFTNAAFAQSGSVDIKGYKPNLGIPIPTVHFAGIELKTVGKTGPDGEQKSATVLDVPWLGNYIGGVYEYAIGVAIVVAAVMAVIGGFQYMTAGGDAKRVSAGKDRIVNALIGIVLVLAAYIILNTINTELTHLRSVDVQYVEGQQFVPLAMVPPGVEERGGPASDQTPTLGPKDGEPAVVEGFKKAAPEFGVDSCVALAISTHETGLKLNIWNGYPRSPKEKAGAWGPGQVMHANFVSCPPEKPKALSLAIKKKFPDKWPDDTLPCPEQKDKKTELMITDADISTYAAVWAMKANGMSPGNEMKALAGYSAGLGSVQKWQQKNGCKSQPVSFTEAMSGDLNVVLKKACLPSEEAVEVPSIVGGKLTSKCGDEDKGYCPHPKVDNTATFRGTCTNGQTCVAMDTRGMIKYVAGIYNEIKRKYNCQ